MCCVVYWAAGCGAEVQHRGDSKVAGTAAEAAAGLVPRLCRRGYVQSTLKQHTSTWTLYSFHIQYTCLEYVRAARLACLLLYILPCPTDLCHPGCSSPGSSSRHRPPGSQGGSSRSSSSSTAPHRRRPGSAAAQPRRRHGLPAAACDAAAQRGTAVRICGALRTRASQGRLEWVCLECLGAPAVCVAAKAEGSCGWG